MFQTAFRQSKQSARLMSGHESRPLESELHLQILSQMEVRVRGAECMRSNNCRFDDACSIFST